MKNKSFMIIMIGFILIMALSVLIYFKISSVIVHILFAVGFIIVGVGILLGFINMISDNKE